MAGEAGTAGAADASAQGQAPAANAPAQDDAQKRIASLEAELAATRKEAADKRVKAKEADDRAAAEAIKAATDKGEWSKVIEAKDAALKELGPKASRADKLAAIIGAEVKSLEASLGAERAAAVAHLEPEDRLPILKQFAALTAGKPPAKSTTAGAPASAAPNVDWNASSPDQIRDALRKMTPEQRKALAEQQGVIGKSSRVF